ncbi:hypothetical protein [Brevibacillus laterosporus]|uniref:hypothetical protein n=1 Tax=Brevibacillus laterosporus TaxID=1465 RepID=UPI0024054B74|nr:hypothetical protein [Brevibacillus laterosporus]
MSWVLFPTKIIVHIQVNGTLLFFYNLVTLLLLDTLLFIRPDFTLDVDCCDVIQFNKLA